MKGLAILMLLSASVVFGQSGSGGREPADLIVLQHSWSNVTGPALKEDPFAANNDIRQFAQDQRDNAVRNSIRTREGESRVYTPRPQSASISPQEPLSNLYAYKVKVKNTGSRSIARIYWDYLFLNPGTLEEAGHHSFKHEMKLRPGKEAALSGKSGSPPVLVVNATKPLPGVSAPYSEKVVIQRIEYVDGTVWTRPKN